MRARASVVAAGLVLASRAAADEPQSGTVGTTPGPVVSPHLVAQTEPNDTGDWLLKRKHTLAEIEFGFIALPTAPISNAQRGGSLPLLGTIGHGDATASVGIHFLYRGGSDWAIGAGALFAPLPTSDSEYDAASGLSRTHARSYLWLGTEARYIPLHLRTLEGWVGFTVGGIVVADRFDTSAPPVPPILGSNEVTVRTEGGSVGLQLGGDWSFAERFSLGIAGRLNHWILPANATCTPIGDCSTLTGPVAEVEMGIRLGYRIPL